MTERLYELDGYCREFTATVTACEETEGGYGVILDRTAFFPEGGGQATDTGRLGEVRVTDVQLCKGDPLHIVDRPLEVGSTVTGCIDWEQRFARMQKHTAEHMICGIIHRLYGFDNVGFHLGSEDVTLDINGELTRQQLDEIEMLANRAVAENHPVSVAFPADLTTVEYRSKKELDGPVRIVTIEGVDACACCAPHVANTGEIGIIKLLDSLRYKGGMRIHFQAGLDALMDYQMRHAQTEAAAAKLSVKSTNLTEAVERLLSERDTLRLSLREAGRKIAALEVAAVEPTDKPVCLVGPDWDAEVLRSIVNGLSARCEGLCGAFSGSDGVYQYVVGGHGDLKAFGQRLNAALRGRGGGSAQQIQGRVEASEAEIRAFWQEIGD